MKTESFQFPKGKSLIFITCTFIRDGRPYLLYSIYSVYSIYLLYLGTPAIGVLIHPFFCDLV